MNRKLLCVMFLVVATCGLQTLQADYLWDVTADFSSTSNTATDTWQYMHGAVGFIASNTLLPTYANVAGVGFDCWYNSADDYSIPLIGKDDGVIKVHGGSALYPAAAAAVIAWRAPDDFVADTVNVDFQLTSLVREATANGIDYCFYNSNGTLLANGVCAQSPVTGDLATTGLITLNDVAVQAGQKLYLHVGTNGNLNSDLAAVSFVVTAVPEPAAIVTLAIGLFGLVAYAWRKRG